MKGYIGKILLVNLTTGEILDLIAAHDGQILRNRIVEGFRHRQGNEDGSDLHRAPSHAGNAGVRYRRRALP